MAALQKRQVWIGLPIHSTSDCAGMTMIINGAGTTRYICEMGAQRRSTPRILRFATSTLVLVIGLVLILFLPATSQNQDPRTADKQHPFKIEGHEIATCLQCHGGEGFVAMDKKGLVHSYFVDGKAMANSVHKGLTCQDCH